MIRNAAVFALTLLSAGAASGAGTEVAFGGLKADPTLPVEVTSDALSVDQTNGTAVFTGNVVVVQGDMRMSAAEIRVEYTAAPDRRVARMTATGGVTLVSGGGDAASSEKAVYSPETGVVVMTGDVVLTQGANAMSGQSLTVDLDTGTGRMEGRVTTTLAPAKKN
ncbi:MAG: lipopolysaccharide transport periplasmic protein LptA [Paracoccaceae bacterium]